MSSNVPPVSNTLGSGRPTSSSTAGAKTALYVVMRDLRWHVVRPDEPTALSSHDQRDDAVAAANALAASTGAQVLVFDLGGKLLRTAPPLSRAG